MSLQIHGLDLRLAKKMLFTGVNLRIDKPNLVVYVLDEAGLAILGADVNILSSGHNLNSVTDALGTALTRFMPAINNTLTVSKVGYATSTQIIYNETPSTLSVYVRLFASEIRLKVVNNQNEPIEGATCRVLYAISGSNNVPYGDGVDDYIRSDLAKASYGTAFSIEFWIKPTGTVGSKGIFQVASVLTSGVPWILLQRTNNTTVRWWVNANYRLTVNVADDEWCHLALTFDGTTWRAYKNGVLAASYTGGIGTTAALYTYFLNGYNGYFKGNMADARIWGVVKSEADILAAMNTRLSGDEANLTAYYKMDEGTGTTAADSAGSYDGTIYGATWAEVDESFPFYNPYYPGIGYDTTTPYDSQTTNANGLTTLNYQINTLHGLEVTLPGKRRFIMPFNRERIQYLEWQVMLSNHLATFLTDNGELLINANPQDNDNNFLLEA